MDGKERLPREAIKNCIGPILMNLREYTTLSVPLLRGLRRMLGLLSGWFNPSLGEKLVEHMIRFADPGEIASRWHSLLGCALLCCVTYDLTFASALLSSLSMNGASSQTR